MPGYQRILLKLSGEAMAGPLSFGLDPDRVNGLAAEISAIAQQGVEVGVVVGGGNIFRGIALAAKNMDRVTGDHMGMLATVRPANAVLRRTQATSTRDTPDGTRPCRCGARSGRGT